MFPKCCGAFFTVVSSHDTAADKAPQLRPSHWLLRIARHWMNDILCRMDECRAQRGCNEKWARDAHCALSGYHRTDENIDGWIYGCMGSAVIGF